MVDWNRRQQRQRRKKRISSHPPIRIAHFADNCDATLVTFPTNVLSERPELNGVSITVPANALFSDSGVRGGMIGIAPVPPDRLPGPLPDGLKFPLVITVQTDGAQNFDQPVPACFPNLPDPVSGLTLPPGAKTALWSFNHDTGKWEIKGPATISADGMAAPALAKLNR